MYKCDVCKEVAPTGAKQRRVIDKVRDTRYPFRPRANRVRRSGKKKLQMREDPGGTGQETVTELALCPKCYGNYVDLVREREVGAQEVEHEVAEQEAA